MLLYMQSLWGELWTYLVKRYFDPDLPYFYHLSNETDAKNVVLILGAVLLGILAAGTAYVYQRRVLGAIPRAVIAGGAADEKTALPLPQLGVKLGWLSRLFLRSRTGAIRKYLRFVGESELTYEDLAKKGSRVDAPIDFDSTPCYIPLEKAEECTRRFSLEKSGGWGTVAWFWVGGIVLFFVLCRILPTLLEIADRLAGAFA